MYIQHCYNVISTFLTSYQRPYNGCLRSCISLVIIEVLLRGLAKIKVSICFVISFSLDSYYFPSSQFRPNVLLDKKSHDRIQTWLSEQHEYTGYPPPEEESIASLRSSSAVDVLSNDRSPIEENLGHFPKYRSEERIQSPSHFESDEQKRIASLKRYNSPDCIRRRYFSPRSDPNLNTVGKQAALLPTRSVSYKHLWPAGVNDAVPDHLSRTFYQGGKGNTFPRRNKFTVQQSARPELNPDTTGQEMGQNMEKYQQQQRVLLNPYASVNAMNKVNTRETENFDSYEHIDVMRKEEPVLAGRTFVLNGISLQNKQDVDSISSCNKNSSSVIANLSRNSPFPVASTETTEVVSAFNTTNVENTLDSNQTDLLLPPPNPKTPELKQQAISNFHMRVASAPATTDSNNLESDLYWRSKKVKRKVSHEVRKVKAFSWPKRAVLLEQTDKKFLDNVTKRIVDRTDNNGPLCVTEKREDTNNNYTHYEDESDDGASDQSDIPPERPPLPAEHMYSKREGGSHSSVGRTHSQRSSRHTPSHSQISEEKIFDEVLCEQNEQNEYGNAFSMSDAKSVSSEQQQHYHSPNCELSKRVSMSLKDLIRIHEKEIARVSGAFSTHTLDKIEEKSSNDTFARDEYNRLDHTKWKRHTTIGLLGDHLHDSVDDVDVVDDSRDASNPEHASESGQLSADVGPMSPNSSVSPTTRKFNITISSRAASDASEAITSPLSPKMMVDNVFRSPPSTLPKPKKVTTSSMVTSPLQTVVTSPRKQQEVPQRHSDCTVQCEMSYTTHMSDSSVQTEENFVRTPSFRKNESRVRELTEENEKIRKAFAEERNELNKKLQEQRKVANAYQKLEDRYRKKVYELQKSLKLCNCSTNNNKRDMVDHVEQNHHHYRFVLLI